MDQEGTGAEAGQAHVYVNVHTHHPEATARAATGLRATEGAVVGADSSFTVRTIITHKNENVKVGEHDESCDEAETATLLSLASRNSDVLLPFRDSTMHPPYPPHPSPPLEGMMMADDNENSESTATFPSLPLQQHQQRRRGLESWRDNLSPVLSIATPVTASYVLRRIGGAMTTAYAGHTLGSLEFSAVITGMSLSTLTSQSIGNGLSCAFDTLGSHAFGCDPTSTIQGLLLQRAMLVSVAFFVPIVVFYFTACEAFLAYFMDYGLAANVTVWLKLSTLYALPMLLITCVHKYAQIQHCAQVPKNAALVGLIALPVFLAGAKYFSPLICAVDSSSHQQQGSSSWVSPGSSEAPGTGAPGDGCLQSVGLAFILDKWFLLVVSVVFTLRHPQLRSTMGPLFRVREAARWDELEQYLRVGLPSLAAMCADSWAWEMVTLIAARLGPQSVGVWGLLVTQINMVYAVGMGLASAGSVTVGAALGENDAGRAFGLAWSTSVVSYIWAAISSVVILFMGRYFNMLLTKEEGFLALGAEMCPYLALFILIDFPFFVYQGTLRGCKMQSKTAVVVLVTMWGIGVPASALGAHWIPSLKSIVIGLSFGNAVGAPALHYLLFYGHNWRQNALEIWTAAQAATALEERKQRGDELPTAGEGRGSGGGASVTDRGEEEGTHPCTEHHSSSSPAVIVVDHAAAAQ